MHPMMLRGFYAILDLTGDEDKDTDLLERRGGALLAAAPCCLQLRAKTWGPGRTAAAARRILPLSRASGVPFCMNDRLDVALAVGADMVHVGQEDLPLGDVLRVLADLKRTMWVGVSTHTKGQAEAAVAEGANYIGFGPIFGTYTKENPDKEVGLDALALVAGWSPVPVVAIGGITRTTVGDVARTGAHAAAVIADVERAIDKTEAGRAISAAFKRKS